MFMQDAKDADFEYLFCKSTKNPKIIKFEEVSFFAEKISHPVVKAMFTQAPLLSLMSSMGKRFNFHVFALMMLLKK